MKNVNIESFYEKLLANMDQDLAEKHKIGCINNFMQYVKFKSPHAIQENNGKIFVPDSLITDEYLSEYFKKNSYDISVKDCAYLVLNHPDVPPLDEMSVNSLEKTIRDIFQENKDKTYIKRIKGNVNTLCVDYETALKISSHSKVISLVQAQIKKAEKNHKNTVDWRAYEFQKDKINALSSAISYDNEDECHENRTLSANEKTYLMVKAIFNKMFSDFDFQKFEDYLDEMDSLYDDWDFGKRYQELYDIFHSPHYNYEFYQISNQMDFLDLLADKVAQIILKKIGK